MKRSYLYLFWLLSLTSFAGCTKTTFLDAKPNSSIVIPSTLPDLRALLSYSSVFGYSPTIGEVSADNYYLKPVDYNALPALERNLYVWEKDLYGARRTIDDWSIPNQQVLYANIVLEQWGQAHPSATDSLEWKDIKGAAHFQRAYAMMNLLLHFASAYDSGSASSQDGIPIRLTPDIHSISPRSKLQACVDQVIWDTRESLRWLQYAAPLREKNRPTRCAAYALLSRLYLACRAYELAGKMADSALTLYPKLIDYNTVNTGSRLPFDPFNDESVYFSQGVSAFSITATYSNVVYADTVLYQSYAIDDLRKNIYYRPVGSPGNVGFKSGYSGTYRPFTGLATDELYFNRAEAAAKAGRVAGALDDLNAVLIKRWKTGTFIPPQATTPEAALTLIRVERRKELVWRGIRWIDLKRYNMEGANLTLTRQLGPDSFTLPPGSPRYVFPFPDDEISMSGISQNPR